MARILIGNIKGPKGDTGAQGPQGATGPQGPQGPLPPLVNNALATEAGVSALDAAMGKTLQEQITNNKNDITELNSNTVQNHNAVSDDPDDILTTSVRSVNGWSSTLHDKLPSEMINSWIICITSTTYEGYIGESILQILISVQRPYIAVRGGNASGSWGDYTVYQLQKSSS